MFTLKGVKYQDIVNIDQLDIKENKVTSIIGESGAGKSTLLKLLNHMISFDEGDIEFLNQSIKDWDPIQLRRKVSMVSQQPAIFDGTIRDNLEIGLTFAERPVVNDTEMESALSIVKLNKPLDTDTKHLSGGEQQRLVLARMILIHPPIVLLDEPTSALDTETEDFVMNQFINWARKNRITVIMVTHSRAIAEKYSDEIIKMAPHVNPEVMSNE